MMNEDLKKVTTTFQHYVVAFIDVLGQTTKLAKLEELLDKGETGEPILEAKRETIDIVKYLRNTFYGFLKKARATESSKPWYNNSTSEQKAQYKELRRSEIRFRYISDGIIIYAPLAKPGGVQRVQDVLSIIMATAHLILVSLGKNVAIRGAVELGWATKLEDWANDKEDADIYGPIIPRVHYLESTIANYPRIIVGNRLVHYLELMSKLPDGKANTPQERLNKTSVEQCRELICYDMDGQFIVDLLGPFMQKYPSTDVLAKAGYKFIQSEYIKYKQLARDSREINSQAKYSKLASRYANLIDYFLQRLPNLDSEAIDKEPC